MKDNKFVYNNIKIFIMDDYEAMSEKAASLVAAQMILKNNSVLGLATGSTPEGMYRKLVEKYQQQQIDFHEVMSFNLDEYYPILPENKESYAYYMNHHLFQYVNLKKENIHIPSGSHQKVEETCKNYDQEIAKAGNIDLQILGIGNNGHIGFNEPDIKFEAGTHLVSLDEATIEANSRFFDSIEAVPKTAISMGIRNIMHSKKIVLLANGKAKANILKEMLSGPVTPNLPASILQLHNDVTIIVDEEAAEGIKELIQ